MDGGSTPEGAPYLFRSRAYYLLIPVGGPLFALQFVWWTLATLAGRLGVDTVKPNAGILASLKEQLPHAPHESLSLLEDKGTDPRIGLAACLPFNFR